MIISKNMSILFAKLCENIYNNNMKRLFLLILSFIFLGGAVSSSAFFISSSLNAVETRGGSSQSDNNITDNQQEDNNYNDVSNANTLYSVTVNYVGCNGGNTDIRVRITDLAHDLAYDTISPGESVVLTFDVTSQNENRLWFYVNSTESYYTFELNYYPSRYNGTGLGTRWTETNLEYNVYGAKYRRITYNKNNGEGSISTSASNTMMTYGWYATIPENTYTRAGYIANGWNTMADGTGTHYDAGDRINFVDNNMTLYAEWISTSYVISYDSNNGQGSMGSTEVNVGASVTLPKCTFTRTGYEFAGWALSSTGAVVYADGASITPTASMTLYAVWRAEVYTITLNWQGGSGATWSTIYFRYGGIYVYTDESCSTGIDGSALLNNAERAGFSFISFTTNADGSGTVMYQDYEYLNLNTIVADDIWYAQWQVNNEAKYDSVGGYWYVENGKIPQTKVTDSTLINALNSATTNGSNYYIAGLTLQARVYNGTEYCQWNGNWYEVEPIKWRLTKDSNQTNGYGTTTDINAVLAEIVFVGQYSSAYLGSGAGYSTTAVEEFKKNGIDETYFVDYQNEAYNFGNGTTMYNLYKDYTNMFVANESEINSVSTTTAIEFSDLAKDIIKSYGGTNVYFTRDLGSNYNNIVCFNEVGREVQRFATDYRGVQFTVRFTEYGCVD